MVETETGNRQGGTTTSKGTGQGKDEEDMEEVEGAIATTILQMESKGCKSHKSEAATIRGGYS